MTDTIEIVIASPDHGYTWDAWMGDEQILRGASEPLFDACRVLLKRGVDPKTRVATRHAGQPYRSLTTTVEYGAAHRVSDDGGTLVFKKFELNNNDGRGEPAIEREQVGGTLTAAEALALTGGAAAGISRPSYEPG
jgi:hypothetical protein